MWAPVTPERIKGTISGEPLLHPTLRRPWRMPCTAEPAWGSLPPSCQGTPTPPSSLCSTSAHILGLHPPLPVPIVLPQNPTHTLGTLSSLSPRVLPHTGTPAFCSAHAPQDPIHPMFRERVLLSDSWGALKSKYPTAEQPGHIQSSAFLAQRSGCRLGGSQASVAAVHIPLHHGAWVPASAGLSQALSQAPVSPRGRGGRPDTCFRQLLSVHLSPHLASVCYFLTSCCQCKPISLSAPSPFISSSRLGKFMFPHPPLPMPLSTHPTPVLLCGACLLPGSLSGAPRTD